VPCRYKSLLAQVASNRITSSTKTQVLHFLSRAYLRKFIEHRSSKGSEQWSIPVRAPSYNHPIALITFGLRALFWHTDPLLFKAHDTLKNARGSLARIAEGKIEASNEDTVMLQKAICILSVQLIILFKPGTD
jgi:hypothetical protein